MTQKLDNSVQIKVPEYLWHWSRVSEIIPSDNLNFYSGCRYVGETCSIIDKMTNFWRLVFSSIILLLATICDTLIRIRENHWLLRLMSSFSESVFRICV